MRPVLFGIITTLSLFATTHPARAASSADDLAAATARGAIDLTFGRIETGARRPETIAPPVGDPSAPTVIDRRPAAASGAIGLRLDQHRYAGRVRVSSIAVDGVGELGPDAFGIATAPFVRVGLAREDLQDLLGAVAGVARSHGFVFARSSLPAQDVSKGTLRVALDLGRIDRIDLRGGSGAAAEARVRATLAPLLGRPVRQLDLERRLLLAADLPGVGLGHIEYSRVGAQGVLSIELRHVTRGTSLTLDNRGSHALGPDRVILDYDLNGLFNNDRFSLSGQVQTVPHDPDLLVAANMRIAMMLDQDGTQLSFTGAASQSHPRGELRAYDVTGDVRYAGVALTRPLLRTRSASFWLGATLDYFAVDQYAGDRRFMRDREAVAGISLNGYAPFAGGQLRAGAGFSQSLAILGATVRGDPFASRPGAGAGATIFNAFLNWHGTIGGPFTATLSSATQISSGPLPIISQIAFGGPIFGRAFDFAERTGDNGLLGAMELQYNAPDRTGPHLSQLYGFIDGGTVRDTNYRVDSGDLASAGFGARVAIAQKMRLELELAFPLDDARGGNRGSPRLSASAQAKF